MKRHILLNFIFLVVGAGLAYGQGTVSGTQYHIGQFTTPAGTTIGNTNSLTDSTGNNLTVPGKLAAQQTNSVFNSDQNTSVSNTLNCGGCEFLVPFTSPDTTSIQTQSQFFNIATPFTGHDYRPLTHGDYFGNAGLANSSYMWGRQTACGWGSFGTLTPNGTYYCDLTIGAKIGGGINIANAWSGQASHYTNYTFATRGQSFVYGSTPFCYHVGDCIDHDTLLHFRGGATDGSGEGDKIDADHLLEDGAPFGMVTSGTAGGTTIVTSLNSTGSNPNAVQDGGYLVFEDEVMDNSSFTGVITNGTTVIPHLYQTSSTHAVSTWQAVIGTGGCGPNSGANVRRDAPVNTPCTYTLTSSTSAPSIGSVVAVADPVAFELAKVIIAPTGGNITLGLTYNHPAGVPIMFGGTVGGTINLNNGLSDPTTSPQTMTAYPNGGSPDATHVYVVLNYLQGQQGEPFLPLPPRYTNTLNVLTCTGGVVSTDIYSGNFSNTPGLMNPSLLGSAAVTVAGNSSASMNGTVTNVQINYNANTATWTAPGGSCGSSGGTGGTIAIAGNWNFTEYKAAEVTAIASGCLDGSGLLRCESTLHLEPNIATQGATERIVQPNHYATNAQMHTDQMIVNTTNLVGNNNYRWAQISGQGMSGAPLFSLNTGNAANTYVGLGGTINPNSGINFNLPVSTGINFLYAPSYGAPVINVGCPAANVSGVLTAVCSATQANQNIIKIAGFSGNGSFAWNGYNSTWGFFAPVTFNNAITAPTASIGNITSDLNVTGGADFNVANVSTSNAYGTIINVTNTSQSVHTGGWDQGQTGNSSPFPNHGDYVFYDPITNVVGLDIGETGINAPGVSVAGNPVCQQNGTNCPANTTGNTTAVGVTGVTSVTCATATCTNVRGTYTIVGGTATTGNIATLTWPTTTTPYVCQVAQNGGSSNHLIGNSVATSTGLNITAGASVAGASLAVNYSCIP